MATKRRTRPTPSSSSSSSSPVLLPGELAGAVPYRHPVTGERCSRTEYVAARRSLEDDARAARWREALEAGSLDEPSSSSSTESE